MRAEGVQMEVAISKCSLAKKSMLSQKTSMRTRHFTKVKPSSCLNIKTMLQCFGHHVGQGYQTQHDQGPLLKSGILISRGPNNIYLFLNGLTSCKHTNNQIRQTSQMLIW